MEHGVEQLMVEKVLRRDEVEAREKCIKQELHPIICVRVDKTTGKHHLMGGMGSLKAEKHVGNAHYSDLFRPKRQVKEGLMKEMMKLFRAEVDKGEDALKAEMKTQRVEHLKRASVVRKANNMEHNEAVSGKNLLARRHIGFTNKIAEEFIEEE